MTENVNNTATDHVAAVTALRAAIDLLDKMGGVLPLPVSIFDLRGAISLLEAIAQKATAPVEPAPAPVEAPAAADMKPDEVAARVDGKLIEKMVADRIEKMVADHMNKDGGWPFDALVKEAVNDYVENNVDVSDDVVKDAITKYVEENIDVSVSDDVVREAVSDYVDTNVDVADVARDLLNDRIENDVDISDMAQEAVKEYVDNNIDIDDAMQEVVSTYIDNGNADGEIEKGVREAIAKHVDLEVVAVRVVKEKLREAFAPRAEKPAPANDTAPATPST